MAEARVQIGGAEAVLDAAGALWLPQSRTLAVADLHLEKSSSLARRGVMLPPYDTGATLASLGNLVARRRPRRVVCLGDSFHDSDGFGRLASADRNALRQLQQQREWIWITGNHDPDLPAGSGGEVLTCARLDGLTFRHEPTTAATAGEVAGHLHPAGKIRGHGRAVRCRAFAGDGARLILPAFGVLTGGLNLLDRVFAPLFEAGALRPVLIAGERLFPVAYSALCPD